MQKNSYTHADYRNDLTSMLIRGIFLGWLVAAIIVVFLYSPILGSNAFVRPHHGDLPAGLYMVEHVYESEKNIYILVAPFKKSGNYDAYEHHLFPKETKIIGNRSEPLMLVCQDRDGLVYKFTSRIE